MWSSSLDDLSWAEIQSITRAGKASSVFDIGDTKTTQCLNLTGGQINAQGVYSSPGTTNLQNTEFTLVAIDVDKPTASNLTHSLTFFAKSLPLYYRGTSSDYNWNVCGARKYLNDNYQEILPEAYPYITEVSIIALGLDSNSYNDATQSVYTSKDKLFVPSAKNVGWYDEFGADDDEGDQNAYPYFTSSTQRQLGSKYALRTKSKTISDSLGRAAVWAEVLTSGTIYSGWNSNMNCGNTSDYKRPLCFCIG